MSETPILVLGGTGKTGRRVARQLVERGHSTKVASRSDGQRFDWQDDNTWASAVDGVEAVYLVDSQDEDAAQLLAERAVQDSGASWTVLRPTWFAQNFSEEAFLSDAVIGGEVVAATIPTGVWSP